MPHVCDLIVRLCWFTLRMCTHRHHHQSSARSVIQLRSWYRVIIIITLLGFNKHKYTRQPTFIQILSTAKFNVNDAYEASASFLKTQPK